MSDLQEKLLETFDQLDAELKRADSGDIRLEFLYKKIRILESYL